MSLSQREHLLCSGRIDRSVAIAWAGYNFFYFAQAVLQRRGLPLLLLLLTVPIHNLLLIVRHAPRRFATDTRYLAIGVAAGNWGLLYRLLPPTTSIALAPLWLSRPIVIAGTGLWLWARIGLGRAFGMLPADRGIVTGGTYGIVRHPFYSACALMGLGYLLAQFSPLGLTIWIAGNLLNVACAFAEERFLATNPQYAAYAARVRYRFVPGLF